MPRVENGGVALRLRVGGSTGSSSGETTAKETPEPPMMTLFRIVRRAHDTGENWVEVNIRGSVEEGSIARDDGQVQLRKDSWIEKQRARGHRPRFGTRRGAARTRSDTDDRFEVVKKGDAWLIHEFPRTIPERGAKSLTAVGERR